MNSMCTEAPIDKIECEDNENKSDRVMFSVDIEIDEEEDVEG